MFTPNKNAVMASQTRAQEMSLQKQAFYLLLTVSWKESNTLRFSSQVKGYSLISEVA